MSEEMTKYNGGAIDHTKRASALDAMAQRLGVDAEKMLSCLRGTCFKGVASNEQMMALVVVANSYKLNPFTKEIYAFPDSKSSGIVPMVSIDGWCRIINEHPQLDGIGFEMHNNGESCTCTIYRKDRKHPISVTEYLAECYRKTAPWTQSPKRMLRHKALIQCARYAFGFAGIYDADEAEIIAKETAVEVKGQDEPQRNDKKGRSALKAALSERLKTQEVEEPAQAEPAEEEVLEDVEQDAEALEAEAECQQNMRH